MVDSQRECTRSEATKEDLNNQTRFVNLLFFCMELIHGLELIIMTNRMCRTLSSLFRQKLSNQSLCPYSLPAFNRKRVCLEQESVQQNSKQCEFHKGIKIDRETFTVGL